MYVFLFVKGIKWFIKWWLIAFMFLMDNEKLIQNLIDFEKINKYNLFYMSYFWQQWAIFSFNGSNELMRLFFECTNDWKLINLFFICKNNDMLKMFYVIKNFFLF